MHIYVYKAIVSRVVDADTMGKIWHNWVMKIDTIRFNNDNSKFGLGD